MESTAILESAMKRAATVRGGTDDAENTAVEAIRDEIGRHHYEKARAFEPELMQAIQGTYLPFAASVRAIAAKSGKMLPDFAGRWLAEIESQCSVYPAQLRRGIAAYESIRFDHVRWATDPRQIDPAKRAEVIAGIRRDLRTYDGAVQALGSLRGRLETHIDESNWPSSGRQEV